MLCWGHGSEPDWPQSSTCRLSEWSWLPRLHGLLRVAGPTTSAFSASKGNLRGPSAQRRSLSPSWASRPCSWCGTMGTTALRSTYSEKCWKASCGKTRVPRKGAPGPTSGAWRMLRQFRMPWSPQRDAPRERLSKGPRRSGSVSWGDPTAETAAVPAPAAEAAEALLPCGGKPLAALEPTWLTVVDRDLTCRALPGPVY